MDDKKRIAKGIKLNASQLPLSNKADFVIGADSRKVLDNKIIENLHNTGSHGYFPATVSRDYKSWSVSRELEIPSIPAEAEAQMRMIEGATAAESLQSEYESVVSNKPNPFDPSNQPNPFDTSIQPVPLDAAPVVAADLPSPWGGPIAEVQPRTAAPTPAPTPSSIPTPHAAPAHPAPSQVTQVPQAQWTESPWAGPDIDSAVTKPTTVEAVAPLAHLDDSEQAPVDNPVGTPIAAVDSESGVIPSWMNEMASDDTSGSAPESQEALAGSTSVLADEAVPLETFLNSIPDEQFVIDNETMRHLFSSLIEPKTSSVKIKSPASDAADLAIAAAAAEILKSEVSIDEISIEDIATDEVLAVPEADFEAIQKAYEMLDLSPIPESQRKDGLLVENVYAVIEKAAAQEIQATDESVTAQASGSVTRTQRGTIEMATHAGGRQLVPQYNNCGMLISVQLSDGMRFILSEEKNTWQMIEESGKVMVNGIQSVSFDKLGNLSYVTKRGDTVTLKIDGTIGTKFAKKEQVVVPAAKADATMTQDAVVVEVIVAETIPEEPVVDVLEVVLVETTAVEPVVEVVVVETISEEPLAESRPISKAAKAPAKPTSKPSNKATPTNKRPKSDVKPQPKKTKPSMKSSMKPDKKGR